MSSVLGVSVGTSAVRMASPVREVHAGAAARFRHRVIDTTFDPAEQLAAQSIGEVLADPGIPDPIAATGVAYRDDAQAGAVAKAMARQHIANYRLVPEVHAAINFLRTTGDLDGLHTVALYDLGSSGLSVTVVDLDTGAVLASERSFVVSGNLFDALIRDNQIGRQQPGADGVDEREFEARCRVAKEQLSANGAVCIPGMGGLILLSREAFDAMAAVPVESSARLTRDVVARAGRPVDALVLVGGGARIPLVQETLASWVGLRTITPDEPELVAAKGAALSATPVENAPTLAAPPVSAPAPVPPASAPVPDLVAPPQDPAPVEPTAEVPRPNEMAYSEVADPRSAETPAWLSGDSGVTSSDGYRRRSKVPLIAALGLAIAAAAGLILGYGGTTAQPVDDASSGSDTTSTTTAVTTTPRPTTTTTTSPPPSSTTTPPPVVEDSAPVYDEPAPAPAPAPAPPPLIPGLPQFQLPPPIQLPPLVLPRF
ncbi:Hsp70 family protein [Rhodococcoides corynebacterioides]|uniref:Hsp70 family protein n=1 Tax=Rhodococcoides corynebacterioides TaxID=53972 RepID=A0ABS7P6R7_9NOCA|nr:Hsp70 family protein [Rhodococcus corynebacterioides]MBY6368114.1 Hsp70 family protein [Rhodococcus corynebacterioides]MBY6409599.1 Hsp70 family protein [Rhodococcus corynebacterioides]